MSRLGSLFRTLKASLSSFRSAQNTAVPKNDKASKAADFYGKNYGCYKAIKIFKVMGVTLGGYYLVTKTNFCNVYGQETILQESMMQENMLQAMPLETQTIQAYKKIDSCKSYHSNYITCLRLNEILGQAGSCESELDSWKICYENHK